MRNFGEEIGKMLVDLGLIEKDQLDKAIARGAQTGKPIGQNLIELGIAREESLLQLIAAQGAASPWDLEDNPPANKVIKLLAPTACKELKVLPIWRKGDLLLLAMANPDDQAAIDRARALTGLRIEPVLADEGQMLEHVEGSLNSGKETPAQEKSSAEPRRGLFKKKSKPTLDSEILSAEDTAPVVGLVDQFISDSIRREASEIHIEPTSAGYEIRFRIDGDLHSVGDVPSSLASLVAARLKIMASLDIFESAAPQSGTITIARPSRIVLLHVESIPTSIGERFMMRIQSHAAPRKLEDIGFNETNLELFRRTLYRRDGLVIVAGPSRSGKTTMLYSALEELAAPSRSIVTCEPRVEHELSGVTQTQYGGLGRLGAAELLNSVMRQAPDVIMVGELSDEETARATVRAALAGSLVFCEVESRDALAAIPILFEMGVDPYLIGASLAGIAAQRRLRTLCPKCRTQSDGEWRAVGCKECDGSGYVGFVTVHEVLPITKDVASLIARKAQMCQIEVAAREAGFLSLRDDAMDKVQRGLTDVGEVERVLGRSAWRALPTQPAQATKQAAKKPQAVTKQAPMKPAAVTEQAPKQAPNRAPDQAPRQASKSAPKPAPVQRNRTDELRDTALKLVDVRTNGPQTAEDLEAHFHVESYQREPDSRRDAG